tara:strand:+ start:4146 stop:4385 length:240 start_codon:yes stop_codon:yes gene_type:complete
MLKDGIVVGRIPRNAKEEVRVQVGTYWGRRVLDIRWFKEGEPTKKGIRLAVDGEAVRLQELMKEVNRIIEGENDEPNEF